MPLMTIVYAVLAGLGIVFGVEATKDVKVKPGNWKQEMRTAECRQIRLAPWIGANDPCESVKP